MNILDYIKDHLLFLDGGMGTLLQAQGLQPGEFPENWNMLHPDVIQAITRPTLMPAAMWSMPIPSVPIP